jgi:hypothetical protein
VNPATKISAASALTSASCRASRCRAASSHRPCRNGAIAAQSLSPADPAAIRASAADAAGYHGSSFRRSATSRRAWAVTGMPTPNKLGVIRTSRRIAAGWAAAYWTARLVPAE